MGELLEDNHQITLEANIMRELTAFYLHLIADEGDPKTSKLKHVCNYYDTPNKKSH